jgi:hypothetical protein
MDKASLTFWKHFSYIVSLWKRDCIKGHWGARGMTQVVEYLHYQAWGPEFKVPLPPK